MNVLNNDAKIEDVTINHAFVTDDIHSLKWFKISAGMVKAEEGKYVIVSFSDITKEKQYEDILKHELTLDHATGTINKQNLMGILMDLTKYANQYNVVSVGIIDMDNFKEINDNYGHLKGDEVLNAFSELARANVRKQDIIGRFGGEEFMFVFPGVGIKQAAAIIQRIHNGLKTTFEGQEIRGISFSAGFTELSISELGEMTKEEIIEKVDGYLYQAKQSGKQKFVSDRKTVLL
jgi:diguanylate cyclase (GGDEF)-like protein